MVAAQGFRNITRPSDTNNNSGTCIDNIFIKLDKINYKTFTLKIPLNDHFSIFMSINDQKFDFFLLQKCNL